MPDVQDHSDQPFVLGLITARAGSKGLPGKHLLPLGNKPLLQWTCEAALAAKSLSRVIISTDGQDIADCAQQAGVEVPFIRPSELAGDDTSHVDVVLHALNWWQGHENTQPDYLCLLQPTSPFRRPEDIDAAISLLLQKRSPAIVGVTEATDHPYLTQQVDDQGQLTPFIEHNLTYARRQDLPPAYVVNGAIYIISVDVLRKTRSFLPAQTLAYIMPRERSMDIDSDTDLMLAQAMLDQKKRES